MPEELTASALKSSYRRGRNDALRDVKDWLKRNSPALTVDLSTGEYINIEDLRLYLTEAMTWPENRP